MGLEIKISAYKNKKVNVSVYDLMKQLTEIKDIDWVADVPSQSLQNSLERLDSAYKTFFRTYKSGGGFPKFKSKRNYNSILFKSAELKQNNKLKLPKIGEVKFFKDKSPIIGKIKTAQITIEPTGFFVCIVCDNVNRAISNNNESQVIGVDMGVKHFMTDSSGDHYLNPRIFKKYEEHLANEQRILSGKNKYSNRYKKQAKKVALIHHKIANVRKDYLHKLSTDIAKRYHTVFVEDLKIKSMTKSCKPKTDENGMFVANGQSAKSALNKAILDSGWGMFRDMLAYKTNVIKIDPKYTSQTCQACGKKDAKNRISQSEFECKKCGYISNADVNAAKNILSKGMALVEIQKTKNSVLSEEPNVI
jgi:putative transposase